MNIKAITSLLSHEVLSLTLVQLTAAVDYLESGANLSEAAYLIGNLEFCEFLKRQKNWISYAQEKYEKLEEEGIQILYPGHVQYPIEFYELEQPPLCLSYWGETNALNNECLSIVGAREPDGVTVEWMEEVLGAFFKIHKPTIVSGGARGVDQMAHRLAIRNACPTIAILPSGLKHIYPLELENLKELIWSQGGGILSEFSFEQRMQKSFFAKRNRLISSLGNFVLIVEGKLRSGTMLTAQWALKQNKTIAVVPGHPLNNKFSGNLELISSGANIIRDVADLQGLFELQKKHEKFHFLNN